MSPFRWLEARVPPLIVTVVWALAMWGAAMMWPSWAFAWPGPRVAVSAVAWALAVVGFVVCAAGVAVFRMRGTSFHPRQPHRAREVVSDGIYAYTRNPMYLGLAMMLAGEAVGLAHPVAIVLVALYVLYLDRLQIVPEERALRAKFGPAFDAYAARVRRWL